MTFRSDRSFQNAVVEVIGDVAAFVTISPSSFASIPAGQDQTVNLSFSIPQGTVLGTLNGTIQVRSGGQTLSQGLLVALNIWQAFTDPDFAFSFRYPPTWTGWPIGIPGDEVTISNVSPGTQPNPESMQGVCKVPFITLQKPSDITLQEWVEADLEPPSNISLDPIIVNGLTGLREVGGEIALVDTVFLPLSNNLVLSVALICGADMQAAGDPIFEKIIATITVP